LDAAASGFTEFTAEAASFHDSINHLALTPLRILILISKQ
jgi:hypothetical protein